MWRSCVCVRAQHTHTHTHTHLHILSCASHPIIGWIKQSAIKIWAKNRFLWKRRPFFFWPNKMCGCIACFVPVILFTAYVRGKASDTFASLILFCPSTEGYFHQFINFHAPIWILNDSIQGWCACMCVPARLDAASEQAIDPFRANFLRQGAEIVRSWLEPEVPKLKTMPWYFQKTKAASGARRMWPSRFRSAAAAGGWSQIAALASPIIKWI